MEHLAEYIVPWSISNILAILVLLAAITRPRLGRLSFVLLFGWASWLNYTIAHADPADYLNYAELTPFGLYRDFINSWFREHITEMVTAISIGQGSMAIGFLLKGQWVRIACIGAIIFFLAICPLGIGSGFPAPFITAIASYFILKK